MEKAKGIDVGFIKGWWSLLEWAIWFIFVAEVFFVLLLSVISITGSISGTKNISCVASERVTCIKRFFIWLYFGLSVVYQLSWWLKSKLRQYLGFLWLVSFKLSIASNSFGLKLEILIFAFKSKWIISSFFNGTFVYFSDEVLIIKVKDVLHKTVKTNKIIQ